MKRSALAGTFALLAGGVTLLLLVSIFYSCRGGGHPHEMGSDPDGGSHSNAAVAPSPPIVMTTDRPASAAVHL